MKNPIKKPVKAITKTITNGTKKMLRPLGNSSLRRENKKLRAKVEELQNERRA